MEKGKRLKILTNTEIKSLYGIPQFDDEERKECFSISITEEGILKDLKSVNIQNLFYPATWIF